MNAAAELIEDTTTEKKIIGRFPMNPYPRSWYCVLYSDELKRGELKTVHYFGQDLVVFRTELGQAAVVDPHCPHMGAHLGHGGKVVGNSIECPFHGWKFDVEGTCSKIDYCDRIPKKAQLNPWLTREANGMVYVWFDREGNQPDHQPARLAEYEDKGWSQFVARKQWEIKTHPQEIAENAMDTAHFETVHGIGLPSKSEYPEVTGTDFISCQSYDAEYFGVKPSIVIHMKEPGIAFTSTKIGKAESIVIASMTPIDEENIVYRFAILSKKSVNLFARLVITKFMEREIIRQFEQDIVIWENKKYLDKPMLCKDDGDIRKVRKWYAQFN
ncbi:MAG: (2Fe-2S)-binding protein [Moraxellaceae bacterium]|nr:MAG: (2Fe-2S)-binding protein [Moraxellaceae bacterium]